ncbi:ABC transporter ATP-binding protein [Dethiosulfovibrio sp. F2B]|uniref:ABC transporter ATP-binding protein n=1 Tax=Dethiosulfovibrio faecalis TaxID=2720018 RepID=UPI001F2294EF|nr:ABC transporter ATP-binding protein [Dethiosulfovibrio faecalis]MCF4151278.1 ABC transporter ATP-binding protein [Dethiosulfovibrio faecalis]
MYLRLNDLKKSFEGIPAVNGLSIDIEEGEMVSLLGPSGCGKTTTLKMVGGFVSPDGGTITLDGEDITELPPERRPTATVFQSYALFPHMTVLQNVAYGLKFRGIKKKAALRTAEEMLERVGLPTSQEKTIHQLSGGEQQRVALARALVIRPKVLLMDEPLSNLDAKLRIRMRSEIRRVQRDMAITAIYVTHDQEEALALSDRIAVMERGIVAQTGTPYEIYSHPDTSFVADFIGRSNFVDMGDGRRAAVHPEDVSLSSDGGDFTGTIIGRQFKGAMTTYSVRVGQSTIEADVLSRDDPRWDEGNSVHLKLNRDKLVHLD